MTTSPKERLLEATMGFVAAHGVGGISLRQLAEGIGTSHRMLVYHFGSKEGLLVEVVRAVEAQQRAALAELELDPLLAPMDRFRLMWRHFADPALWPNERLFFELYGQALQGRAHTGELLDGIIDDWLDPLSEAGVAAGLSPADARANARLGVAVTRGLLLDLLATGDRKAVDAAMERFIALYEAALPAPRRSPRASAAAEGAAGRAAPPAARRGRRRAAPSRE